MQHGHPNSNHQPVDIDDKASFYALYDSIPPGTNPCTIPGSTPPQSMNRGASLQLSPRPGPGSSTGNSFAAVSFAGNLPATIHSNRRQDRHLSRGQNSHMGTVRSIRPSGGPRSRMHPISPATSLPNRVCKPPRHRPGGSFNAFNISRLSPLLPQDLTNESNQYHPRLTPPHGGNMTPMHASSTTQSYPETPEAYSVPPLPPDEEFLRFEHSIPANPYAAYPASQHPAGM
jgi:hypothetical protein